MTHTTAEMTQRVTGVTRRNTGDRGAAFYFSVVLCFSSVALRVFSDFSD